MKRQLIRMLVLGLLCSPMLALAGFSSFPHSEFFTTANGFTKPDLAPVDIADGQMVVANTVATLSHDGTGGAKNHFWIVMDVKPVRVNDSVVPPDVGDDPVVFYFDLDGKLNANDGASWADTGYDIDDSLTGWVKIAVHVDLSVSPGEYQLYVGAQGSTTLSAVVGSPSPPSPPSYQINGDATDFTALVIEAGDAAYVDNVGISAPATEATGVPPQFVPNDHVAILQTTGGTIEDPSIVAIGIPGFDYALGGPLFENRMNSKIGNDLKAAMKNNDMVSVARVEGGFETFTLSGGSWSVGDPDNAVFGPATLVQLTRVTAGNYFGFFPYTDLTEMPDSPMEIGDEGNPRLTGTGNPQTGGFNPLVWPKQGDSPALSTAGGWGFQNPAPGDRIYVLSPFRWFYYNNGWKRSGSVASANDTVALGTPFYYFCNTPAEIASTLWNP